jgi:RNA polymerase sigma-70 factor (ECF subfamily)
LAKPKPAKKFTAEQFADFYDQHIQKLYRYFYYKVFSVETAEDLTSETFLAFANQLDTTDIQNPQAFLYTIAYRKFQDFLRAKYKLPMTNLDISEAEAVQNIEDYVSEFNGQLTPEEILSDHLPKLPPQQREIIELRLIQKLSLNEICDRIGKDMSYVKTTQNRAIKNLKQIFACLPSPTNLIEN